MQSTSSTCAEMALLLQADIDGELDAAQAASVTRHREQCSHCTATYQRLQQLRGALRADLQQQQPQPSAEFERALRQHLRSQMPAPVATPRPWRRHFTAFGTGAALAAALLLLLPVASTPPNLVDAVMTEHIRSLQAGHLLDVVSTDQHTVKPWFNGKLDFVPPVRDFAENGFVLTGGRLDYLNGRAVAALVYHRGLHPINLFVWPDPHRPELASAPKCQRASGYHLCNWQNDGMEFWAISDLNEAELQQFSAQW